MIMKLPERQPNGVQNGKNGTAVLNRSRYTTPEERKEIFDKYMNVADTNVLADIFHRARSTINQALNRVTEERAPKLLSHEIKYIDNEEFRKKNAEETIMAQMPERGRPAKKSKPPQGLPPYLKELYQTTLLERPQERHLFRQMNYLKHEAKILQESLKEKNGNVSAKDIRSLENLLGCSTEVHKHIVESNLRLAVPVVKKYVNVNALNFMEKISEGNAAIMRAADKFDYGRGFKFSTYATWAIDRGLQTEFNRQKRRENINKQIPDNLEMHIADHRENMEETHAKNERQTLVHTLLENCTKEKDRKIMEMRYGFGDEEAHTLEQIGDKFGVTKERIRQIQARIERDMREYAEYAGIEWDGE